MDFNHLITQISIWAVPVLLAITLHEAAHGWAAYKLGDDTASLLGRITLNPLAHIDPIGTVAIPALLLLIGSPFLFGWAKPVPVNPRRLYHPKRDMGLVAAAGPGANLLMVIFWIIIFKLGMWTGIEYLYHIARAGIIINIVLIVLNLLPILPLDGGRIVYSLLPYKWAKPYGSLEPFGLFIVIGLLASHILDNIMSPVINAGLFIAVYIP